MLCSAESRAICVLGCSGFKCLSIYGIRSTFLKRIHSTDMEVALWVVKTIQRFFAERVRSCCSDFFIKIEVTCHVCNIGGKKNDSLPSLI